MKKLLLSLLMSLGLLAGPAAASEGGYPWDTFPVVEDDRHGGAAERREGLRQLLPELPLGVVHALQPPERHRHQRRADQEEPAVRDRQGRRHDEDAARRAPGQGMVRLAAARPVGDRAFAARRSARAPVRTICTRSGARTTATTPSRPAGTTSCSPTSRCRTRFGSCRASAARASSRRRTRTTRPRRCTSSPASRRSRRANSRPLQYDETIGDLVAYLQWMAEPAQGKRIRVGVWVLLFLGLLVIFTWRLSASYWKDVK